MSRIINTGATLSLIATISLSVCFSSNAKAAAKVQNADNQVNCNLPGASQSNMIKLQKHGGDPSGPDPHGPDPKDEQHDADLPANRDRSQGKAPRDVYGDQVPNGRTPY